VRIRGLTTFLAVILASSTSAFDLSFWVWQRSEALSPEEMATLQAAGVRQIYWHVGELVNRGDQWQWKTRFPLPSGPPTAALRLIPVVRLVSKENAPFGERSFAALRNCLMPVAQLNGALQIDYDSPDRLLDDYGGALGRIHEFARELTITGLPHWSRSGSWRAFEGKVDALFPMFYDFESEPNLANDSPKPLIDSATMAQMLSEWAHSPLPWFAGLPGFARLTVYDSAGKSRGQVRNWNWDEITFNRHLAGLSRSNAFTFVLKATETTRISNVTLAPGHRLVARWTNLKLLQTAWQNARQAGATGAVIFRLPDTSAASSGFSVQQLAHPNASPVPQVHVADGALVLKNSGAGDLLPQLSAPEAEARGYRLEISVDKPVFREAEPGDFARLTGIENKTSRRRVALPFATQISFDFSELRAGQSLRTGLIQLAPGASFRQIRYRIQPLENAWKSIEEN
jgi:hypothetical protein